MISVCMATYNGELFIKDQIQSILKQLNSEDELIISDDTSSDNTMGIIQSLHDPRIKVLPNNKFRDPIRNFENALQWAKGDYIFLSDQDDIWLDHKVEVLRNHLRSYDLVVSDCRIVDQRLSPISDSYLKMVNGRTGLFRNLLKTSPYIGCCMAFRRNVLQKSLPFPQHISMHDFWIALVGETFFKNKIVYEPLVLYRRHGNTASNTGEKSVNSFYQKLMKRITILFALLRRGLRS